MLAGDIEMREIARESARGNECLLDTSFGGSRDRQLRATADMAS